MSNDSAVTDAELVERARRGDAAAFDALVRRYLRAAYALALSLTHDHHDAEDVCQEACVRSLAHLGECRTPARFAGWFFAIVRSAAMHWRFDAATALCAMLNTFTARRPAATTPC